MLIILSVKAVHYVIDKGFYSEKTLMLFTTGSLVITMEDRESYHIALFILKISLCMELSYFL